jgi:hypothetical protein
MNTASMHCIYMYYPESCAAGGSHLNIEFGTAKPSAIPVGRTVKAFTDIQLVRIGLVN